MINLKILEENLLLEIKIIQYLKKKNVFSKFSKNK